MIARVWRGWTLPENGDAYADFLGEHLFPDLSGRVPGFRGGHVLRRELEGEHEFLVLTLFDSLNAVRDFAGDNYDAPVIGPEAARLLRGGDKRAAHYQATRLAT